MAGSSSSVSWTPAPGRHAVNIGPSLGKALKARKLKASPGATATTKRSNLPERDFYSFRFNFKPPSIDTTKPATIEILKSADNTKVLAEYPSEQSGEAHIFLGSEQSAREVDCVLIYDEDTGTYSLEKLDSFVNLRYDRKTTVSPRPSPAPTPTPKAALPVQKTTKKTKGKGKQRQPVDDLERDLLGLDEDAEGDIDMSMEPINPKPIVKEEEEEEEELPGPPKLTHPIPAKPQLSQKPRQVKPIPKPRVEAKVSNPAPQPPRQKLTPPPAPPNTVTSIPPPKTRPVQKKELARQREPVQQTGLIPKKESAQRTESTLKKEPIKKKEPVQKERKAKPIPATTPALQKSAPYADEEVIEFGRPAKRPRQSTPQRAMLPPTPPATVVLSLPGGSSSFAPPPPPPGSHNSKGTGSSSRDVPPPAAAPAALSLPTSSVPASPPMMGQYSDEEEDWDEVSTANLASASLGPSKSNSNIDDDRGTYDLALEQDIFGDVFEEVDGDDATSGGAGAAQQSSYVDGGDGEEEEIDMNAFEQELNEHMEVVDDSDDDVFGDGEMEEQDVQGGNGGGGTRQPISLNRMVSGGVGVEMSEEEYSSSDESDED